MDRNEATHPNDSMQRNTQSDRIPEHSEAFHTKVIEHTIDITDVTPNAKLQTTVSASDVRINTAPKLQEIVVKKVFIGNTCLFTATDSQQT
jgi:hypothetical protein